MIKTKWQSTIIALNEREFDGKFIKRKWKKILPQIWFIDFPPVGLQHFYKLPSPLQKIFILFFHGRGESCVNHVASYREVLMLVVMWVRLPQVEKAGSGLFSSGFVSSNRMVANLTAAVFPCQRRGGTFACINKSCGGPLANSHKLKAILLLQ